MQDRLSYIGDVTNYIILPMFIIIPIILTILIALLIVRLKMKRRTIDYAGFPNIFGKEM